MKAQLHEYYKFQNEQGETIALCTKVRKDPDYFGGIIVNTTVQDDPLYQVGMFTSNFFLPNATHIINPFFSPRKEDLITKLDMYATSVEMAKKRLDQSPKDVGYHRDLAYRRGRLIGFGRLVEKLYPDMDLEKYKDIHDENLNHGG